MPEKTVREMTALERRHYSLEARMFHAVEMASAVLGLVALLIGLGLYLHALVCNLYAHHWFLCSCRLVSLSGRCKHPGRKSHLFDVARKTEHFSTSQMTQIDANPYKSCEKGVRFGVLVYAL